MKSNQNAAPERIRSLPIEEWHRLGLEGSMLPVTICLEGDSMRPLIRRGIDRVTILPLSRPLEIGDIVLFHGGPGRYVVHRVWKMRDGSVKTLGDNCFYPDPWMPLENVWGIVVKMERGGRTYRLDSAASRNFGKFWMAIHPARNFYRRCRSIAGRCWRRVFPKTVNGSDAGGR